MRLYPQSLYPHVSIAECGEVVTGSTPSKSNPDFWDGVIPFVTPSQLGDSAAIVKSNEFVTSAGAASGRLLPEGAVLVCCIGSLGKSGVAGVPVITNQQINAIVFNPDIMDSRYGYYAARQLTPLLEHYAPATTLKIVKKSMFSSIEIPLPPLPEQKRIAAILDKADELRAKRREAIAELDKLIQATFLDMFGDPVTNPRKLSQSSLKDVFQFTTGKLDSNAAVEGGKYPFFTCAKENFAIDEYAFDCEALLLAGNNANADYSVKHFKGKFNAYQRTYVISVDKAKLTYEYAKTALEFMLADLKRYSKGSNTKYLTLSILNRMPILLPSLDEQHRFSQRKNAIYRQVSVCRNHENSLNSLFQSLQSRVFNGEL